MGREQSNEGAKRKKPSSVAILLLLLLLPPPQFRRPPYLCPILRCIVSIVQYLNYVTMSM